MVTIRKILAKPPSPAKGKPGYAAQPDATIHHRCHEGASFLPDTGLQCKVSIQPVLTGASLPIFPVMINAALKIIPIRPCAATIALEWLHTL